MNIEGAARGPKEAVFNPCGSCSMCCKLLSVQADDGGLFKPFLRWCRHAVRPGGGCGVYQTRPESCRLFECLYAASQRALPRQDVMPPEMRPDRCGVIFGPADPDDPEHVYNVHCDPDRPLAWKRKDVKRWIERIVGRRSSVDGRRIAVVLSVGTKHTTIREDLPNMRKNIPRNIPAARVTPAVGMRSA
jgi:Fe-S-cluster containining protein